MANWKRGFFRLWVLISVLWVVAAGVLGARGLIDPYISDQVFTLNNDGQPEMLIYGTDRYTKAMADEQAGFYQRVSFKDVAPQVFYLAPNTVRIPFRGRTYTAMATTANLRPDARASLIDTLADYLLTQDTTLDHASVRAELEAVVPPQVIPAFVTKEIGAMVKEYAVELRSRSIDEARWRNLGPALAGTLLPPIILFVLGSSLAWVVSGFRRRAA